MSVLKKTPLFSEYEKFGAKTIDFGGWDLPVQFSSIKHEHELTRTKATMFDVSHMGEIVVKGPDSLTFLQRMVTNDVSKLKPNKAQYTFMCYEDGGIVDDFLIYMLDDNHYLLVVNAANTEKDFAWLQNHQYDSDVTIEDVSDTFALLAVQGPLAEKVVQKLTNEDLADIKVFSFKQNVQIKNTDIQILISRTGYTGEDGFELYIPVKNARELWDMIVEAGEEEGLEPAGLGARDTLRFEAGLPLYGQELSKDITPIEVGLNFAVKLDKGDFVGKTVLQDQKENGVSRRLVGLEMIDKGIPRTGYDVLTMEGEKIGFVTSGTQSPTLKKNIGLAMVDINYSTVETELIIQVRKRQLKAIVISTPFYKRDN